MLVVEAGVKGGALITARIALDYGVPVCAVPGDVDRVASAGTNLLIRDGAFPVFGPDDLTEILGLLAPSCATRRAAIQSRGLWPIPNGVSARVRLGSHPASLQTLQDTRHSQR